MMRMKKKKISKKSERMTLTNLKKKIIRNITKKPLWEKMKS